MDSLESWEKEFRQKLELEIPEGIYSIVVDGKKYLTGKGGIIDQMVDMARASLDNEKK